MCRLTELGARGCYLRAALVISMAGVLAGCKPSQAGPCAQRSTDDTMRYTGCLGKFESLAGVTEMPPFTILKIYFYKPGRGGYYFPSVEENYQRILHGGRVVVPRADSVEGWSDIGRNVVLATIRGGENGDLHLLDSVPDAPLLRQIPTGSDSWAVDEGFSHGYPWDVGRRYLPRGFPSNDAGVLFSVDPFRVQALPKGPRGVQAPWIERLAAVSPDGRAFAYVDSRRTPSAIIVAAADGALREPLPLPLSLLPDPAPGANPFEPLRAWFSTHYIWKTDAAGTWDIHSRQSMPPENSADAVEQLFTDAARGYRHCFASANSLCLRGWERIADVEALTGSYCDSPYTYAPLQQIKAFDARVLALSYRELPNGGSGYALLLADDAGAIASAMEARLTRARVPFVRADRCPDLAKGHKACERLLEKTINWREPENEPSLTWHLLREAEQHPVFLTPTLAVGLYNGAPGQTWLITLDRYLLPGAPAKVGRTAPNREAPAAALFHRG